MSTDLRLDGVRFTYPGTPSPALAALTLRVAPGACTVMLGPSGSGKSTVLRLVAGLLEPQEGDVRIGGSSVVGLAPEKRGLAMVFQRPTLFPHLTVLDNVAFAARMHGAGRREARHTAARYLELVRLDGMAARTPCSLSGGQAQRVALARALAAEPSVLLLDEPFSALDPSLTDEMHTLLEEVRAILGPTILMVTHDQAEAARLGDTVAVLVDGEVLQHAEPVELYARPASAAVHRFLGGLNELDGDVRDGALAFALGRWELPPAIGHLEGPATLLLRQEAITFTAADDVEADAVGTVRRSRTRGPRALVEITTAAGVLHAECIAGSAPARGAAVGLRVPLHARTVVARDESRPAIGSPTN